MRNHEWHKANPLPIYPRAEFLGWHLRHEAACNCRPLPDFVLREFEARGFVLAGHVGRMEDSHVPSDFWRFDQAV